jgi:outer membrane protein OmpA-like peptidoglycan-associated protein
MKIRHTYFLPALLLVPALGMADITAPLPAPDIAPKVVESTFTETTRPGTVETTDTETTKNPGAAIAAARMDATLARQRLGIAPKAMPVAPQPGAVVETTETTTTVQTPGHRDRVYNTQNSVVITGGREFSYLTVPVLFVEGTADLLNDASRMAVEDTAAAIKEVIATNPTAVFDVEGHTSTDGADDMNMRLSADRARRIFAELTTHYGVPVSALSAHGYGEMYPNFPNGTESQMVLDRRVLVVRVR